MRHYGKSFEKPDDTHEQIYISTQLIKMPGSRVSVGMVWRHYAAWCGKNHYFIKSIPIFGHILKQEGFEMIWRFGQNWVVDVALKDVKVETLAVTVEQFLENANAQIEELEKDMEEENAD